MKLYECQVALGRAFVLNPLREQSVKEITYLADDEIVGILNYHIVVVASLKYAESGVLLQYAGLTTTELIPIEEFQKKEKLK